MDSAEVRINLSSLQCMTAIPASTAFHVCIKGEWGHVQDVRCLPGSDVAAASLAVAGVPLVDLSQQAQVLASDGLLSKKLCTRGFALGHKKPKPLAKCRGACWHHWFLAI